MKPFVELRVCDHAFRAGDVTVIMACDATQPSWHQPPTQHIVIGVKRP